MNPSPFSEVLKYVLTDEDRKTKSEEMSAKVLERQQLKLKAKRVAESYSSTIKLADQEIEDIAALLEAGSEMRPVDCEWRPDWLTKEMVAIRLDTFEEFRRRAMTPGERQRDLYDYEPETLPTPASEEAATEQASEEDSGTPIKKEFSKEEIERIGGFYCADKISYGKPVKLCYVEDSPFVIVGIGAGHVSVDAWPALPIANVNIEETFYYSDAPEPFTYQNLKVNCGSAKKPDWWVLVGPEITFTIKPDVEAEDLNDAPEDPDEVAVARHSMENGEHVFAETDDFTAHRCDECAMIEGGHTPTCSKRVGALTFENYLAYAQANYTRNHKSFARKMELTRAHDADVRDWLARQKPKAKEATANAD